MGNPAHVADWRRRWSAADWTPEERATLALVLDYRRPVDLTTVALDYLARPVTPMWPGPCAGS